MALLGNEEPRVYTPPLRELTPETSWGFSVIEFAERVLGIPLFPWQRWFYVHALERGERSLFRFRTIVLLVARQNGKTTLVAILVLWAMYVFGMRLTLGTAQDLDTAEESWERACSLIEDTPELAEALDKVSRVNGRKEIRLATGERYKIAAATRKSARGKSCDLTVLDELREHMTFDAWSAITKTTNARPDALVVCMSNAGDAYSVVLRHLRFLAHRALGDPDGWCKAVEESMGDTADDDAGGPDTLGLFEWSAAPDRDKWDRAGWCEANPSLGHGTVTERVIASDCATDKEADFRTEDLCQWVETVREQPFPEGAWEAGIDPASEIAPTSPLTFAFDVAADRRSASIAVAGMRADGDWHVEVIAHRTGSKWAAQWVAERVQRYSTDEYPMTLAIQGRGSPASFFAEDFRAIEGLDVIEVSGASLPGCCGRLWDSVAACLEDSDSDAVPVRHRPQPVLDLAATTAATKPLGDAAWVFDRTRSPEDCAPLMACALALGCAMAPAEARVRSSYEDGHGVMFV